MGVDVKHSEVRAIEWGNTFRWVVRFDNSPAPFNKWFPATDVEEGQWNLESRTIEVGLTTYKLPISTSNLDLKVTFIDTQRRSVREWLRKWVRKDILNDDKHLGFLDEIARRVEVIKLSNKGEIIQANSYYVYPEGSQYWNGNNSPEADTGMVEFVILSSNIGAVTGAVSDTV